MVAGRTHSFGRWFVVHRILLTLFLLGAFAFLSTNSASASAPIQETTTTQAEESAGNDIIGKNLFTGTDRFEAGGPPCLACHSIGGLGALGGGALGPNLPGPTVGPVAAAMAVWPEGTMPMKAIYGVDAKPLTADEKSHLQAYFENAFLPARSTEAALQLMGLAAVGVVVFLGLGHLAWIRRTRSVRRAMVGPRVLPGS
jgi:mono/diheme cytochrome c family protein